MMVVWLMTFLLVLLASHPPSKRIVARMIRKGRGCTRDSCRPGRVPEPSHRDLARTHSLVDWRSPLHPAHVKGKR